MISKSFVKMIEGLFIESSLTISFKFEIPIFPPKRVKKNVQKREDLGQFTHF